MAEDKIFPVSLECFKKCTYYEELVETIFKIKSKGNTRKLEKYLSSEDRRNLAIQDYYKGFYLDPHVRKTCPIKFKPVPKKLKEKLLQYAVDKQIHERSTTRTSNDSFSSSSGFWKDKDGGDLTVIQKLRSDEIPQSGMDAVEMMAEDDSEPHSDTVYSERKVQQKTPQKPKPGKRPAKSPEPKAKRMKTVEEGYNTNTITIIESDSANANVKLVKTNDSTETVVNTEIVSSSSQSPRGIKGASSPAKRPEAAEKVEFVCSIPSSTVSKSQIDEAKVIKCVTAKHKEKNIVISKSEIPSEQQSQTIQNVPKNTLENDCDNRTMEKVVTSESRRHLEQQPQPIKKEKDKYLTEKAKPLDVRKSLDQQTHSNPNENCALDTEMKESVVAPVTRPPLEQETQSSPNENCAEKNKCSKSPIKYLGTSKAAETLSQQHKPMPKSNCPHYQDLKQLAHHCPVTASQFVMYTNFKEALQPSYRKKHGTDERYLGYFMKKYYLLYYLYPSSRLLNPLRNVQINDDCPEHIKTKLLEIPQLPENEEEITQTENYENFIVKSNDRMTNSVGVSSSAKEAETDDDGKTQNMPTTSIADVSERLPNAIGISNSAIRVLKDKNKTVEKTPNKAIACNEVTSSPMSIVSMVDNCTNAELPVKRKKYVEILENRHLLPAEAFKLMPTYLKTTCCKFCTVTLELFIANTNVRHVLNSIGYMDDENALHAVYISFIRLDEKITGKLLVVGDIARLLCKCPIICEPCDNKWQLSDIQLMVIEIIYSASIERFLEFSGPVQNNENGASVINTKCGQSVKNVNDRTLDMAIDKPPSQPNVNSSAIIDKRRNSNEVSSTENSENLPNNEILDHEIILKKFSTSMSDLRSSILKELQQPFEYKQLPVEFEDFLKCSRYKTTMKQILCNFCEFNMELVERCINDIELYTSLLQLYYRKYFTNAKFREKFPLELKCCPSKLHYKMLSFVEINSEGKHVVKEPSLHIKASKVPLGDKLALQKADRRINSHLEDNVDSNASNEINANAAGQQLNLHKDNSILESGSDSNADSKNKESNLNRNSSNTEALGQDDSLKKLSGKEHKDQISENIESNQNRESSQPQPHREVKTLEKLPCTALKRKKAGSDSSHIKRAKETYQPWNNEPIDKTLTLLYVLRTTFGIKQRITKIVLNISFQDFKNLTHIYQGDPTLYDDDEFLNRMYEYACKSCVWPKELYIKLEDLCALLRKERMNIPASHSTLLEYISPKFLHWSDLLCTTTFESCMRLDYLQRTGEEFKSDNRKMLENYSDDYYNRCWKHEKWIGKIPWLKHCLVDKILFTNEATEGNEASSLGVTLHTIEIQTEQENAVVVDDGRGDNCQADEAGVKEMRHQKEILTNADDMNCNDSVDIAKAVDEINAMKPKEFISEDNKEEMEYEEDLIVPDAVTGVDEQTKHTKTITGTEIIAEEMESDYEFTADKLVRNSSNSNSKEITEAAIVPSGATAQLNISQSSIDLEINAAIEAILNPNVAKDSKVSSPFEKSINETNFVTIQSTEDQLNMLQETIMDVNSDPLNLQIETSNDSVELISIDNEQIAIKQEKPSKKCLTCLKFIEDDVGNIQCFPTEEEVFDVDASRMSNELVIDENLPSSQIDFGDNDTTMNPGLCPTTAAITCSGDMISNDSSGSMLNLGQRLPSSCDSNQTQYHSQQSFLLQNSGKGGGIDTFINSQRLSTNAEENDSIVTFPEAQRYPSTFETTLSTTSPHPPTPNVKDLQLLTSGISDPDNANAERTSNCKCKPTTKTGTKKTKADLVSQRTHVFRALPLDTIPSGSSSTSSQCKQSENLLATPDFDSAVTSTQDANSTSETQVIEQTNCELSAVTINRQTSIQVSQELLKDCTVFNNTSLLRAADGVLSASIGTGTSINPLEVNNTIFNNTSLLRVVDNNDCATTTTSSIAINRPLKVNNTITAEVCNNVTPPLKQQIIIYSTLLDFHYFKNLEQNHISHHLLPTVNYGSKYYEATIICGDLKTRLSNKLMIPLISCRSFKMNPDFMALLDDIKEFHYSRYQRPSKDLDEDIRRQILYWFIYTAAPFCYARLTYDKNDSEFSDCKPMRQSCVCDSHRRRPFKCLTNALSPHILKRLKAIKQSPR